MSPASGDQVTDEISVNLAFITVSIQLMSPASGDSSLSKTQKRDLIVSIQLMSPASGDWEERGIG
jgi:hypothetical protein